MHSFSVLTRFTVKVELQIGDNIEHLGAIVGNKYAEYHIEKPIRLHQPV